MGDSRAPAAPWDGSGAATQTLPLPLLLSPHPCADGQVSPMPTSNCQQFSEIADRRDCIMLFLSVSPWLIVCKVRSVPTPPRAARRPSIGTLLSPRLAGGRGRGLDRGEGIQARIANVPPHAAFGGIRAPTEERGQNFPVLAECLLGPAGLRARPQPVQAELIVETIQKKALQLLTPSTLDDGEMEVIVADTLVIGLPGRNILLPAMLF